MFIKSLVAAAAVAGTVLSLSAPANAKTDIDIYLGLGTGYHDAGYRYDDGYGYDDEDVYRPRHRPRHDSWRVSCGEGREKVRWAGFRKVRPIDCDGRTYQYKARKNGDWYVVTVKSKNGRIVNVEPIY
jgi:hypothetical protein